MKLDFEPNTAVNSYRVADYAARSESDAPADTEKVSQMLAAGVKAAQNGDRNEARQLLVQVTEAEPRNETAWLWMASISEYPEELIIFLNNVLSINPENERAAEWMRATKSLLAETFVERGNEASVDPNKDFARQCFLQAVGHDAENQAAWQALADIAESPEEKISYLQKIYNLDPENRAAHDALQNFRRQTLAETLQKANRAAISGDRAAARELLQTVLEAAPDHEQAWILKAYVADSFSEKITAFERVLAANPENEMAIAGLESLRAMLAKTEAQKSDQAALLAKLQQQIAEKEAAEAVTAALPAESAATESAAPEFAALETVESEAVAEVQTPDEPAPVMISAAQIVFEEGENAARDEATANNETPENSAQNTSTEFYAGDLREVETPAETFVEDNAPAASFQTEEAGGEQSRETDETVRAETLQCPFCRAENHADAACCAVCRTVLAISDLEMLFGGGAADQELLREAVERIEAEKKERPLSSSELKNLAVGQINLRRFRQGAGSLRKASQMNPMDAQLAADVARFEIGLAEYEQQSSAPATRPTSGKKVLIVDDSATIRQLISGKVEAGGHEAVCASDGLEAVAKLKEFTPDLILLDVMMPQMDGYQVCKFVRANAATRHVPVVMISGKDGFFDKVRGRLAGTSGYITKPFGPETLVKTIESYIPQQPEIAAV